MVCGIYDCCIEVRNSAIMFVLPIILCCGAQNFDLCIKLNIIMPLFHCGDQIVIFRHRSEDVGLRKTDKNESNVQ